MPTGRPSRRSTPSQPRVGSCHRSPIDRGGGGDARGQPVVPRRLSRRRTRRVRDAQLMSPAAPDIIGPLVPLEAIVDERYQRRGIGRAIVHRVAELIRAEGATELFTSYVVGDGGLDLFYERLGFVPTGPSTPKASASSGLTFPRKAVPRRRAYVVCRMHLNRRLAYKVRSLAGGDDVRFPAMVARGASSHWRTCPAAMW